MKEVTYGFYPSAKDVYRSKGRPSSYHLECLFKYQDSLYYQGKIPPPQSELLIRGVSSPVGTPQDVSRARAKSVRVPKFKLVPKLHIPTPTQCWAAAEATQKSTAETQWGIVGESTNPQEAGAQEVNWPLPKKKQQHQQQHQIHLQYSPQQQLLHQHIQNQQETYFAQRHQSPQLAWGFRKAQTARDASSPGAQITWPTTQNQKVISARPHSSSSIVQTTSANQTQKSRPASSPVRSPSQDQKTKADMVPRPPSGKSDNGSNRPSRVQSATVRRDKTPLPARPVTASPRKQQQDMVKDCQEFTSRELVKSQPPPNPVPFVYDVNDTTNNYDETDKDDNSSLADTTADNYEQIVNKYGWRAEVHGDPYRLKRLIPRKSYTVACPEPEFPPEPPSVHMETNEPFFYNTIPHKPMVVGVDKEWMSEILLAKRLELQKRQGGIKYSYKNFSFVY